MVLFAQLPHFPDNLQRLHRCGVRELVGLDVVRVNDNGVCVMLSGSENGDVVWPWNVFTVRDERREDGGRSVEGVGG